MHTDKLHTILLLIIIFLICFNTFKRDNFQDLSNLQLLTVPIFRSKDLQIPTYVIPNDDNPMMKENFSTIRKQRENFSDDPVRRKY